MKARVTRLVGAQSVGIGRFLGITGFTVLLAISAMVKIPLFFTPVPVTLQNLVVFLAGAMLGPVCGMAAVLSYIALGLLGAPLFAGSGIGAAVFFGPTGGYLFGFVVAAGLIGLFRQARHGRGILASFLMMLSGVAAIYLCGGIWLAVGYGWTLKQVVALGVLPFLGGDILKALTAAMICLKR